MAATSGPGGPCQPHRVRQLTEDRKKTGRVGSLEGRQRRSGERRDLAERESNCKVLCPSWAELHLLAEFQQEAMSPLDSNRRGKAIGFGPV